MSLLPSELISKGIDAYIAKHSTRSYKLYCIVLVTITLALVSLPFIYVDISVQNTGVIRPATEKTEIKAPISEFVDSIFLSEGQQINKGDTILTLRTNSSNYKINYQQSRLNDLHQHLHDLQYLSKGNKPNVFASDTRRQEYLYFQKQRTEFETNLQKTTKDYERNKFLFEGKVISEEEFDKYYFDYVKAKNELASHQDNQISKWQTELNNHLNSYHEVTSNIQLEEREKEMYAITSPVSGTLEQFRGIYRGSMLQSGTSIAVISPDSTLFIEVYMSPRNIGYIEKEMPVNIQVESFNYNEWGVVEGKVVDISSDLFTNNTNGSVYYKVRCSLKRDYLVHKKGLRGNLKKGMAVSAHFMVTRRSLFDLLYQKMDDWMNPSQYTNEEKSNMASL